MMSSTSANYLTREVCGFCSKQILIGQPITVCTKCDLIFHGKCAKSSNLQQFRSFSYCTNCVTKYHIDTRRYNPFYNIFNNEHSDKFYDDEPIEFTESIEHISKVLENCTDYDYEAFNRSTKDFGTDKYFSTFFLNIDGNQSNFDSLVAEISRLKHKFSIIGLAETNTVMENKDIYQISDDYTSVYQSNIKDKNKGSGIGLYINNKYNFSTLARFSICNYDI